VHSTLTIQKKLHEEFLKLIREKVLSHLSEIPSLQYLFRIKHLLKTNNRNKAIIAKWLKLFFRADFIY